MKLKIILQSLLFGLVACVASKMNAAMPYIESNAAFDNFIQSNKRVAILILDRNKVNPQDFGKLRDDFSSATQSADYQKIGATFAIADLAVVPQRIKDELDFDSDPATMAFFEDGQLVTGDEEPGAEEEEATVPVNTTEYLQPVSTTYVETPVYIERDYDYGYPYYGYGYPYWSWGQRFWWWPLFWGWGFGWGRHWWGRWGHPWHRGQFRGWHGRPGIRPGIRPRVRPGVRPGIRPGIRPRVRPGVRSGVRPGIRPGAIRPARPARAIGTRPGAIRPGAGRPGRYVNVVRPSDFGRGARMGAPRTGGMRISRGGYRGTSISRGAYRGGMRGGGMRSVGMRAGGMRGGGMRGGGMRGGGMRAGGMRGGGGRGRR